MMVYSLGFNLRKQRQEKKWNHPRGWSLSPYFLASMDFTYEFFGPKTNNILLMTWAQTMSQKSAQISHYWREKKKIGLDF